MWVCFPFLLNTFLYLSILLSVCYNKKYNFQIVETQNTQLILQLTWQLGHLHWTGFLEQSFLFGYRQPWWPRIDKRKLVISDQCQSLLKQSNAPLLRTHKMEVWFQRKSTVSIWNSCHYVFLILPVFIKQLFVQSAVSK